MISWNTWPRELEYLQISSMVFVNKDVVKPNLNILVQYVPWSACNQHIFANSFFHGVVNTGTSYSVMKGILRINKNFKSALS